MPQNFRRNIYEISLRRSCAFMQALSGFAKNAALRLTATSNLTPTPPSTGYTVKFKDGQTGEIFDTQQVPHGGSVSFPVPPDHTDEGFEFVTWSANGDTNYVTQNLLIKALYRRMTGSSIEPIALGSNNRCSEVKQRRGRRFGSLMKLPESAWRFKCGGKNDAKNARRATFAPSFPSTGCRLNNASRGGECIRCIFASP